MALLALPPSVGEEHRHDLLKKVLLWRGLAQDREKLEKLARQQQIDGMLKAAFSKIAQEPVPEVFYSLLGRLEAAESRKDNRP